MASGNAFERYSTAEVVDMLDDLNEPMCEASDDDLGLDISEETYAAYS